MNATINVRRGDVGIGIDVGGFFVCVHVLTVRRRRIWMRMVMAFCEAVRSRTEFRLIA